MATVFPVRRFLSVTVAPLIPFSALSVTAPLTVLVVGPFCFAARPDAWSSQATASTPHRTRTPQLILRVEKRLDRAGNNGRARIDGRRVLKLPALLFFFLARDQFQFHGICVHNLQFSSALGAVHRLPFFDIIFDVNGGTAFGTKGHASPPGNVSFTSKRKV